MMTHSVSQFQIYFGDSQDNLSKPYYLNLPDQPLLNLEPFNKLTHVLNLQDLLFLHQIHSDIGQVIDNQTLERIKPFKQDGDFLTTNIGQVGIGIMSGDCLPIVFYDPKHNSIGVAHAGWKGSVIGIAAKTIEAMQETYGTHPKDLLIFFGPAANVCCYKVSPDFKSHLDGFVLKEQVFQERNGHTFFDVPLFNDMQLQAAGVKKENIFFEYNLCTMCNPQFYSHRKNPHSENRQMTVVSLK